MMAGVDAQRSGIAQCLMSLNLQLGQGTSFEVESVSLSISFTLWFCRRLLCGAHLAIVVRREGLFVLLALAWASRFDLIAANSTWKVSIPA